MDPATTRSTSHIGYVPVTSDQMNESLARLERAVEDAP